MYNELNTLSYFKLIKITSDGISVFEGNKNCLITY